MHGFSRSKSSENHGENELDDLPAAFHKAIRAQCDLDALELRGLAMVRAHIMPPFVCLSHASLPPPFFLFLFLFFSCALLRLPDTRIFCTACFPVPVSVRAAGRRAINPGGPSPPLEAWATAPWEEGVAARAPPGRRRCQREEPVATPTCDHHGGHNQGPPAARRGDFRGGRGRRGRRVGR
jgi:hypothetical protein